MKRVKQKERYHGSKRRSERKRKESASAVRAQVEKKRRGIGDEERDKGEKGEGVGR